jgi:glycine dehydrogenase
MAVSLVHPDVFAARHLGSTPAVLGEMLQAIGAESLESLVDETVPAAIRLRGGLDLPPAISEQEILSVASKLGAMNEVWRSYLGNGFHGTYTPPVILRNILQNPGWYTQYTPYQAEISQGRLEALLNYQTMVSDLTGLEIANASLLDEATAAAEAMHLAYGFVGADDRNAIFVSNACHPATIAVVRTRADALGIDVIVGDAATFDFGTKVFATVIQYPETDGRLIDPRAFLAKTKEHGALSVVVADILALTLVASPGELGADIAVGSTQRFGVPLGYGGPHAAFFACKSDYVRKLPGRIIGISQDAHGSRALRMALQTREQHIRREKATSNICTAQALLAITASMYAVYHGPEGLEAIAKRVHGAAAVIALGAREGGLGVAHGDFFDTVRIEASSEKAAGIASRGAEKRINLRRFGATGFGVALDETVSADDLDDLLYVLLGAGAPKARELAARASESIPAALRRTSKYLTHPVFHAYRSEHEMLRYMRMLEGRDLSLCFSMIPLGSCTMKLNATAEMMPITDAHWNAIHPYAPLEQAKGYQVVIKELEAMLREVTGFAAVSLQPNAGSQGEYAGLLVIRAYHHARGQKQRTVCLIPSSAHGTNPASAVMAGFEVVVVGCDAKGNVDLADLEAKAKQHADRLAALMVTYPSTHGVFEEEIRRICAIVHDHGGQVYMDGANMNAQVGVCRPGDFGADVCHLNLHKTFAIPHGGGGPGMGPIGVGAHLAPFLPGHPEVKVGGEQALGPVSQAPWGSASVLLISWIYARLMGNAGLTQATQVAILNANYIATRLATHYPIVYTGTQGRVAHECILDLRAFKKTASVEVEDVAKRLMDYGFHAPTMSWPIAGTLMVEPTESESKAELDRFCDAMIAIREEIRAIEEGRLPKDDNPLKNAPHTAEQVTLAEWKHPYDRQVAAFPAPWVRARKFWPFVGRVNNAFGDRNLVCTCPPISDYAS